MHVYVMLDIACHVCALWFIPNTGESFAVCDQKAMQGAKAAEGSALPGWASAHTLPLKVTLMVGAAGLCMQTGGVSTVFQSGSLAPQNRQVTSSLHSCLQGQPCPCSKPRDTQTHGVCAVRLPVRRPNPCTLTLSPLHRDLVRLWYDKAEMPDSSAGTPGTSRVELPPCQAWGMNWPGTVAGGGQGSLQLGSFQAHPAGLALCPAAGSRFVVGWLLAHPARYVHHSCKVCHSW